MIDFSNQFYGENVTLRARNSAVPTGFSNMNSFNTSTVRWNSVYDAAYTLDISSSSAADVHTTGTGARTVAIYGLDKDFNKLIEVVSLTGQTAVTSTKSFRRVFELIVLTTGTGMQNAGDIYVVKHGTGGSYTGGVPGTLTGATIKALAEDNFGLSGLWTVPRGKVYTMKNLSLNVRGQASTVKVMHGSAEANGLYYPRRKYEATPGMPSERPYNYPVLVFHEKEDIYFMASSGSANGTISVDATFVQQGV